MWSAESALDARAVTVAELHVGVLVAAEPATRAERLRRLSVVQRRVGADEWVDVVAV